MLLNNIISKVIPDESKAENGSGKQTSLDLGKANGIKNMVEQAQAALNSFLSILDENDKPKFAIAVECLSLEEMDGIINTKAGECKCNTKNIVNGKEIVKDIIGITDDLNEKEKNIQNHVKDTFGKLRYYLTSLEGYLESEISVIKANESLKNIDEKKLCAKTVLCFLETNALPSINPEPLDVNLPNELKPLKPNEKLSNIERFCLWVDGIVALFVVLLVIFTPNSLVSLFNNLTSKSWLSVLLTIVTIIATFAVFMVANHYVLKNVISANSKAHDKEITEYYNYIREYREIYYAPKRMELHRDEVAIGLFEKLKKAEIEEMVRDNENSRKIMLKKHEDFSCLIEKASEIDKAVCIDVAKGCRCGCMLNYCELSHFSAIQESLKELSGKKKEFVVKMIKERFPYLKCWCDTNVVIWGIKNFSKYNIFLVDNKCKSMMPLAFDTEIDGVDENYFSIEISY